MKSRKLSVEHLNARLPMAADVVEIEPNNTASQATRFSMPAGDSVHLKGISQNQDDKDFFAFTAATTGMIAVSVQSNGGAKLEIETLAGVDVFETEPNDGINRGSFSAQSGTTYLVRLRSPNKAAADYEATLTPAMASDPIGGGSGGGNSGGGNSDNTGGGSSGSGAEVEPNNSVGQANRAALAIGSTLNLTGAVSKKDRDFFLVTPSAGGVVRIDTGTSGVKVTVESLQGVKLFESEPNDGVTTGQFSVTNTQSFVLRTRGKASSDTNYAVSLTLSAATGTPVAATTPAIAAAIPTTWFDSNDDGAVSPLDALLVIDQLKRSRLLSAVDEALVQYDMNDDRFLSPVDVLLVVQHLNHQRRKQSAPDDSAARVTTSLAAPPVEIRSRNTFAGLHS